MCLGIYDRSAIWQACRRHCCRHACQTAQQCNHDNAQFYCFKTASRFWDLDTISYCLMNQGPLVCFPVALSVGYLFLTLPEYEIRSHCYKPSRTCTSTWLCFAPTMTTSSKLPKQVRLFIGCKMVSRLCSIHAMSMQSITCSHLMTFSTNIKGKIPDLYNVYSWLTRYVHYFTFYWWPFY